MRHLISSTQKRSLILGLASNPRRDDCGRLSRKSKRRDLSAKRSQWRDLSTTPSAPLEMTSKKNGSARDDTLPEGAPSRWGTDCYFGTCALTPRCCLSALSLLLLFFFFVIFRLDREIQVNHRAKFILDLRPRDKLKRLTLLSPGNVYLAAKMTEKHNCHAYEHSEECEYEASLAPFNRDPLYSDWLAILVGMTAAGCLVKVKEEISRLRLRLRSR